MTYKNEPVTGETATCERLEAIFDEVRFLRSAIEEMMKRTISDSVMIPKIREHKIAREYVVSAEDTEGRREKIAARAAFSEAEAITIVRKEFGDLGYIDETYSAELLNAPPGRLYGEGRKIEEAMRK